MRHFSLLLVLVLILTAGEAFADSIGGRFGITGKVGVLAPLRDRFITSSTVTGDVDGKPSFAGGGGIIYGIGNNVAVEVEAMHVPSLDVEIGGVKAYEASFTDLSVGLQYRFLPDRRLVPVIGAGADFIKGDLSATTGANYNMDWTVGGHAGAGFDFFITRGIVFTADVRGIYTVRGDIKAGDTKVGRYDPLSILGTVGFRLFIPETAYR